ncbi:MAG: HD domain-containing protein [Candidatus Pacebacteria bacterium]|nr:HD domain-containing protein [Candidatus Paceibacterota bacterium]
MKIHKEIISIINKLEKKGFEAYLVGGCVRDFLKNREPEDWDIATNARPEEIIKVFPKSFSDNKFGTVRVLTGSKNQRLKEVEITPYRIDEKYSDRRHPDKVVWAKTIKEDLSRRDFTINAMAIGVRKPLSIIDPSNGQKDLKNRIIRAVGNPQDRFSEDALRMMRAVRFSVCLDFKIEENTASAISKNSFWLSAISKERIRDEFLKIIMSDKASKGIEVLRELGLLKHIVPELEEGYGVSQNKHHIYNCYEHSLKSLDYAAKKNFNKYVRLTALFHDIAKPRVKKGEGPDSTFYNHEVVGAKMTAQILERLRFSKKDIEKIVKLVRYHLFYYNVGEVSEASVRRLVSRVGIENMDELLQVRMADRIGSGVPKAEPYKLRHLRYIIEKASRDPISSKMLKVNGNDVMKILNIKAGPKVGLILEILLGLVLSDPKNNKKEFLRREIKNLGNKPDDNLKGLAFKAKKEREDIETKKDRMTKEKYWVS